SGFTDMINPFSARGLGVPGGASGEETLLTTWLVADGYKMDIEFSMQVYDRVIPAQSYPTLYVLSFGVLVAVLFGFLLREARTHI
ncbi:hypothetical protein MJN51_34990, partial [Salmonella enterica subsp. enterica serovar Kentucky]|nr:hypothetical protein [Salmonella enterica subsp. enterica serovar Kentucky]